MANENDPDHTQQDTEINLNDIDDGETDATDDPPAVPTASPAASQPPVAAAPAPSNLAELSAQQREAAKAMHDGTTPETLRRDRAHVAMSAAGIRPDPDAQGRRLGNQHSAP